MTATPQDDPVSQPPGPAGTPPGAPTGPVSTTATRDQPGPGSGQRSLGQLLDRLSVDVRPGRAQDARIDHIVTRSEDVKPGALFVAIPGSSADGHTFIADAARRGAAAIMVERDVGGALDAPLVRVGNIRRALAELAAEWHGRPADRLDLIGITGTAGKTSTLALLEAALLAGGMRVGSIGSLGLHIQGETQEETVYTTPDPMLLHHELLRLADAGMDLVAMEATSHALVQERVHGLRYGLGIFTNLLPLEHSEYHADFGDYVRAKSLFFDLLAPGAPLVYNHDDPVTRELVRSRDIPGVAVGSGSDATVQISRVVTSDTGTDLTLSVTAPVPGMSGGSVEPLELRLRLQLLGRSNTSNAALAATAALCAGARPEDVAGALAGFEPPSRRLQVVHRGRFTLLDDTVGHPESISAFFAVVEELAPNRVHAVYAVRGQRGDRINRENAEALAVWAHRVGIHTLVVTRSAESADLLNEVEEQEYMAFLEPLRQRRIPFREVDRLQPAVEAVLDAAGDGDIVALLGAQGMNSGQDIARAWLAARSDA
jgi:UDP-N-acetylmuramoyl-L-alanyl-D-glutamate--2,6-diaminopimelate ligase